MKSISDEVSMNREHHHVDEAGLEDNKVARNGEHGADGAVAAVIMFGFCSSGPGS
jgi:hypothetical protein